jgi:hypothetical protein
VNGPEHYRRAEALLESCQLAADADADGSITEIYPAVEDAGDDERPVNTVGNALLAAHVHATLAHAAATIDAAAHPGQSQVDYLGAWFRATT